MFNQIATLVGAAMIAAAIYGASFTDRYAISSASGSAVWRLDRWTGEVDICSAQKPADPFAQFSPGNENLIAVMGCRADFRRPQ